MALTAFTTLSLSTSTQATQPPKDTSFSTPTSLTPSAQSSIFPTSPSIITTLHLDCPLHHSTASLHTTPSSHPCPCISHTSTILPTTSTPTTIFSAQIPTYSSPPQTTISTYITRWLLHNGSSTVEYSRFFFSQTLYLSSHMFQQPTHYLSPRNLPTTTSSTNPKLSLCIIPSFSLSPLYSSIKKYHTLYFLFQLLSLALSSFAFGSQVFQFTLPLLALPRILLLQWPPLFSLSNVPIHSPVIDTMQFTQLPP